jgi:hypothetical protein
MHIGHFKQKIYIHWSTALRVTRLKVVARKFLSVKKWHLITAMELFRRFNWHQILYIDVGSSAHKSIPILRRPTHRKRVLNRRHQNFIYIGQCQPKLHIHWVCLSENFIYISQCELKLHTLWPFGTKTLYTLTRSWATMNMWWVLKKAAP